MATFDAEAMKRIAIVGTSCAGKTTFSKSLSARTGIPHVQLDELHCGPHWTARPKLEFRSDIDSATNASSCIVDGNYKPVRDLAWGRADTIVFLNYSFARVFGRAVYRTLSRCITREELYSGNCESFAKSFLSRDSILLWVIQTHGRHRCEYPRQLAEI